MLIECTYSDLISCRINTAYDTAKQMTVIAISDIMYGTTIKMLWLSGKGPKKRCMDRFSMGPMVIGARVDFRIGSIIVAVASVYRTMGEESVKAFTILARLITVSGSCSAESLIMALARTLAPRVTKKEKKIHTARAARADVAVLRNKIENRMATPNQKEI